MGARPPNSQSYVEEPQLIDGFCCSGSSPRFPLLPIPPFPGFCCGTTVDWHLFLLGTTPAYRSGRHPHTKLTHSWHNAFSPGMHREYDPMRGIGVSESSDEEDLGPKPDVEWVDVCGNRARYRSAPPSRIFCYAVLCACVLSVLRPGKTTFG